MDTSGPLLQLAELILIGVVCLLVLGAVALYGVQRVRRRSKPLPDGHMPEARSFSGQGSATLEAPDLIAAQYRLDYAFPNEVLVKIELIEVVTCSSELILLKSGSGVEGFTVETAGRHLFQVEPQDEAAEWRFSIKPVGLGQIAG
jgi:hypothetical protein